MPHTAPDWSWLGRLSTVFATQDLGEVARRANPLFGFDDRGNVLFWDDFEDGLSKCDPDRSGFNASVMLSQLEARYGAYSARLVGGSTANWYARLQYEFTRPELSSFGVQASFRIDGNVDYFTLDVHIYDGAVYHIGQIYYDLPNLRWRYYGADMLWHDLLTNVLVQARSRLFHTCKLVINPITNMYVRALISGQEIDMSAIPLYNLGDLTARYLGVWFEVGSVHGLNGTAYVDGVIITHNEP